MVDATLFESYYRTYNSEDPRALAAYYHKDVVLESSQGTQNGVEAIIATYQFLIAHFVDRMTPLDIHIQGDQGVITILDEFTAKQDVDDFLGMKLAKGDGFQLRLRGTYVVKDGRFKHITIEQLP